MESIQAQLSRRNFVKAMGIASAASVFALAGCAGEPAEDKKEDEGADVSQTEEPEAEGEPGYAETITFAQGAEPRGLDPAYVDDGESAQVMVQIYENLLQYDDEDCTVVPGLCDLPEISDDGLTYTFKVREGIKFHDGTDFNAEAAKAHIERQLEPNRTDDMAYASFTWGSEDTGDGIESIEAPDPTTLVIKLRAASTAFLANIAMCMAAPIVAPSAFDSAMENPVGTGQYKFVSWTKSDNIILERNEEYWNPEKAGKTKNIVFRFIAEAAPRVTALTNGEVDIINGIDEAVVQTVTDGGCELFQMAGMNINYMAFNTQSDIFKDEAARIAVAKAIDVPTIVSSLYGEYAEYANSIMPLWMAPYCADIEQTPYDPEAAKSELAELGITSIKCITYSNPRPYNGKGGQVLAEAIQGYLADAGVDMKIDTYDWTTYRTKVETEAYDVCFYGWNGDNGDPDNFLNLLADPNVSMNVARFEDDDYKALIRKGLQTPAGAERDEVYRQCEAFQAEHQIWLPISHSVNLLGYRPEVSGFNFHPTAVTFLYNCVKTV